MRFVVSVLLVFLALPVWAQSADDAIQGVISQQFEAFRAVLLYGQRPAAWQLLVPLAWTAGILLAVLPLYRSEQRQLAKMVEE